MCSAYPCTIFYNCNIWLFLLVCINISCFPVAPYTGYFLEMFITSDCLRFDDSQVQTSASFTFISLQIRIYHSDFSSFIPFRRTLSSSKFLSISLFNSSISASISLVGGYSTFSYTISLYLLIERS